MTGNFRMMGTRLSSVNTLKAVEPAADVWMLLKVPGRNMREKQVEQKLVLAVKARGGICPKFVSPGFDGMPDRIVLLPGRHFGFVEVKAPGEVPRPLQVSRHRLMKKLGFQVYVLDDPEKIGGILDEIQAT